MKTSKEEMLDEIYKVVFKDTPNLWYTVNEGKMIVLSPLNLGDLLDWLYKNKGKGKAVLEYLNEHITDWFPHGNPIHRQSLQCIKFIYNLCKDE